MRRGSLEWDVDFGAGYQFTQFDLGGASEQGGAFIFGTRFETDLTKQVDVSSNYKLNLALSDATQTSQHAEFVLSIDLYKAIDLDIALTWDFIASPNVDDIDPDDVPEEHDLRLVVGIGVDF